MYIEFPIPMDMSNPGFELLRIRKDVADWSMNHNVFYKEKLVKNTIRILFDDQNTYSFFALTWAPQYTKSRYQLVDPMAKPPK